ncbi:MAG: phosphatase PAP2 family protein [Chitinophagaceae bacterium]|nr:phosphatase PAP2 family protein [Chitinophagaceae bacterium]
MKTSGNRIIVTIFIMLITLTLASVAGIDKPLAVYAENNLKSLDTAIEPVILYLETIFGFGISKYLFGFVAVAVGLAAYLFKRPDVSRIFLFIGLTHIITRVVAGVLKNAFLRPRPFEWLDGNDSGFFSVGNSFPSGHAAHFFGLLLPIVFLYRRFAWMLVLPVFVSLSRIIANDHYLSDVLASVAIAVLFTWIFARLFKIRTLVRPRHSVVC